MQLMCVRFAKWDYKNKDQNLENSSLLIYNSIIINVTKSSFYINIHDSD